MCLYINICNVILSLCMCVCLSQICPISTRDASIIFWCIHFVRVLQDDFQCTKLFPLFRFWHFLDFIRERDTFRTFLSGIFLTLSLIHLFILQFCSGFHNSYPEMIQADAIFIKAYLIQFNQKRKTNLLMNFLFQKRYPKNNNGPMNSHMILSIAVFLSSNH